MKDYRYQEADDYLDMGCEWLKRKEYEKAAECLKHSIELNQFMIYSYIYLAETFAKQKKYGEAFHTLKRASRIDPAFDRLYYLMAKYALKNGDCAKFTRSIDEAIRLNPCPLYLRVKRYISDRY